MQHEAAKQHMLVERFANLHDRICQVDVHSPTDDLRSVKSTLDTLSTSTRLAMRAGCLSPSDAVKIRQYTAMIGILAGASVRAGNLVQEHVDRLTSATSNVLLGQSTLTDAAFLPPVVDEYRPWKDFFLKNIDYPYPENSKAARALAAQIPEQDVHKLRTWLTNNRKRTGWTEVFVQYAEKDRDKMRLLLEQHEDEHLSQLMPKKLFDMCTKVKTYFQRVKAAKTATGVFEDVVQAYKGSNGTPVRRARASSSGSSSPEPSPPESSASVSLRSSSGSSTTSAPYSFETVNTPAPMTRKRSRDEEEDDSPSPSAGKKPKSSLYDKPNRPILGLKEQQSSDM